MVKVLLFLTIYLLGGKKVLDGTFQVNSLTELISRGHPKVGTF